MRDENPARRLLLPSLVVSTIAVAAGDLRGQTRLWSHSGSSSDLDRLGDFDGDGVGDVIAVVRGIPVVLSGRDGSQLKTYSPNSSAPIVAGVGDQDGDGIPDFLLGTPDYRDPSGHPVGRVYGISAATGAHFFQYQGIDNPTWWELEAGCCVSRTGDVNFDMQDDFAFGIYGYQDPILRPSSIHQCWMGGGYFREARLVENFEPTLPIHAIAPLEDIDGDGASDYVAGTRNNKTVGVVQVVSGSTGYAIYVFNGASAGDHFGSALGSCGDQDGDGFREILVGAPGHVVGAITPGSVMIYSGATGTFLRQLDGEFDQQQFGIDVDGLDDIDGDGVEEFVIASSGTTHGRIQVFSGATGIELERIDSEGASCVRNVGDLDGDGVSDVASAWNAVHAWKVAPFLGIDSVTPSRIRYDLAGLLAIHGGGFTADPNLSVVIDGVPATGIVVTSYTDLTCTAPALLPGPHDVTVTNKFGSATLPGGLLLTPAVLIDGDPAIGASIDLRYEFDALDSTFAIYGLPPPVSLPTPPYGGLLGIFPFTPFFTLATWPTDEYVVHAQIPNDPALVGVTVLLQSLTGPQLTGVGKQAAWSNAAALTIH